MLQLSEPGLSENTAGAGMITTSRDRASMRTWGCTRAWNAALS